MSNRDGRAAAVSFERPRLTEQVATHLTEKILSGDWPPGAVLPPEADLAQQFGVSRTVVRECVRVLASRGMLDVRQGRGTFVTAPDQWNVAEPLALLVRADRSEMLRWLEVRAILEIESAARAAQRLTGADHAALGAALERLEQVTGEPEAYAEADIHLHLTIARATQNAPLVRLLHPVVQPLRHQLKETAALPDDVRSAAREHRAIVAAILAGDSAAARAAMEAHLARVGQEISRVLHEETTATGGGDERRRREEVVLHSAVRGEGWSPSPTTE
jgi:DNA-binding FadR family transcriptional regulator